MFLVYCSYRIFSCNHVRYWILRLQRLQQLCKSGVCDISNYRDAPSELSSPQRLRISTVFDIGHYGDTPSELSSHQRPGIAIWSCVTNIYHTVFYMWLLYLTGVLRPDFFFADGARDLVEFGCLLPYARLAKAWESYAERQGRCQEYAAMKIKGCRDMKNYKNKRRQGK